MKVLTFFGSLLCASTALAANSPHKRNVFDKVKPINKAKSILEKHVPNASILERRSANEPFKHPELQKRASRFLTNKTEGW